MCLKKNSEASKLIAKKHENQEEGNRSYNISIRHVDTSESTEYSIPLPSRE